MKMRLFVAALLLISLPAALTGCMEAPKMRCIKGVTYVSPSSSYRAGIVVARDRNDKIIPCDNYKD